MTRAVRTAASARSRCSRSPTAQPTSQPTTRRENRVMATARQSDPSRVQTDEMSTPHVWLGAVAVTSWPMMVGATGRACSLSVVRLNRRSCRPRRPFSRIGRTGRRRPMASRTPASDNQAVILQLAPHARAGVGAVQQRERRTDMRQHHPVVPWPGDPSQARLSPAGRAIRPRHSLLGAGAEPLWLTPSPWQRGCRGNIRLRLTDERNPHRRPARAKQAVARFSSIPLQSPASLCRVAAEGSRSPGKAASTRQPYLQPYLPAALCRASPPADHDCR